MESQDQEVEAFQKWWRENGKVVVIGVVAGLSAVIGWNWWLAQEQRKAEVASSMYSEVVNAANSEQHAQALAQAKAVMEEVVKRYEPISKYLGEKQFLTGQLEVERREKRLAEQAEREPVSA